MLSTLLPPPIHINNIFATILDTHNCTNIEGVLQLCPFHTLPYSTILYLLAPIKIIVYCIKYKIIAIIAASK